MTKSWTDERLEERFDRIDERFDRVDERFSRVESDLRELRDDTKAGFEQVHVDMREIHARFDGLQRTLLQLGGVAIAALLGLIATQL